MQSIKLIAISILLLACKTSLNAQDLCNKYKSLFNDIIAKASISKNKVALICITDINVEDFTLKKDGISEIKIGLRKMKEYPDVVFCGVIAHELGHFLLNHEGPPVFERENPADSICGSIMRKLGFDIDDMSNIIFYFDADKTAYGTKSQRINAYKKGWVKENELQGALIYQAYTPKVTWEVLSPDTLSVWIGDRQLIIDTFYNHGLVFDPISNSTIQLIQWNNKVASRGVGRIVTNRSLYTYRKTRKGYNLYYKAEERPLSDCLRGFLNYDGTNGITPECENEELGFKIQYLLTDYRLAPHKYCMPAQIFIKH
jgi:hypothetical protein